MGSALKADKKIAAPDESFASRTFELMAINLYYACFCYFQNKFFCSYNTQIVLNVGPTNERSREVERERKRGYALVYLLQKVCEKHLCILVYRQRNVFIKLHNYSPSRIYSMCFIFKAFLEVEVPEQRVGVVYVIEAAIVSIVGSGNIRE